MSSNWRILDLTELHGEVRFNKKTRRLEIIESYTGEKKEAALDDVNIIFFGIYVSLAPAVMYHLAANDVVVLFCDWKGLPASSLYPWIDAHGRVGARQRAQVSLSQSRAKNAWMQIIKAKIRGQANNLSVLQKANGKRLKDLVSTVRSGDPSNVEGHAAKIYWRSLFDDPSFVRIHGERIGGRNSLLDYGYTILRGHSMRAVLSAGLTPALGVYHCGRSNHFALADDLIEPFRAVVDYSVARMPKDASIECREVRSALLASTLGPFLADGSAVPTVMTNLAQQFGLYVEGEIDRLKVPYWKPIEDESNGLEEKV